MSDKTGIEWTDATWNVITGCTLVSEGCRNCYAAQLAATRLKAHPSRAGLARPNADGVAKFTGEVRFNEQWLTQPLRWRKPRRIFVCAHGDLFHESVPDEWIDRVFAVMALCPQHVFQVLTKRPERMRDYLTRSGSSPLDCAHMRLNWYGGKARLEAWEAYHPIPWPLPNVWLGVSVEDQAAADERIPLLLDTPAAKRFISAEPLIGAVDLRTIDLDGYMEIAPLGWASLDRLDPGEIDTDPRLDWVIVGGESGAGARPMHPDWVRSLRDQCAAAGVPFFFKQWGEWVTFYDRDRDDPDWRECPKVDGQMGRWATRYLNLAGGCGFHGERVVTVRNIGKKKAGALLDGVTHWEMPS